MANAIKGLDAANERKSRHRDELGEINYSNYREKERTREKEREGDKCLLALSVKIFMRTARLPVSDRTADRRADRADNWTIG